MNLPQHWTIGTAAVGYNGQPYEPPPGQHTLRVTRTYTDGHVDTWDTVRPGEAADAHASLAKRWKEAGRDHQRDKEALTLTARRHVGGELEHAEVVQHVEEVAG